jgi:hypothetical protein
VRTRRSGQRSAGQTRRHARLVVAGIVLWLVAGGLGSGPIALAASPQASPPPSPDIIATGDPRSNGQGPGLVGSPFAVALGVVALAVATAGGTVLYLRLIRER